MAAMGRIPICPLLFVTPQEGANGFFEYFDWTRRPATCKVITHSQPDGVFGVLTQSEEALGLVLETDNNVIPLSLNTDISQQ